MRNMQAFRDNAEGNLALGRVFVQSDPIWEGFRFHFISDAGVGKLTLN